MYPTDDRIVLAYYDCLGSPQYVIYDFKRTKPGSQDRWNLVDPFERHLEALKGQGCECFVWDIVHWQSMQIPFFQGKYRGTKS